MSTKPGVFKLSSESYKFVRENVDVFKAHLTIIFPLFLIVQVIKAGIDVTYGKGSGKPMMVAVFFLFSLFMLSWHRTSLQGPDARHAINPFRITMTDVKFILLYTVMSVIYSASFWLVNAGLKQVFIMLGIDYGVLFNIVDFMLLMGVTFVFIRFIFLLPARAVGVSLGFADAARASKGMVWPVLGSVCIFVLLFAVSFSLYAFVSGMIVTMAGGAENAEPVKLAIIGYILSIPVYVAVFILLALFTTALSKAYQWGMQNNPHEPIA